MTDTHATTHTADRASFAEDFHVTLVIPPATTLVPSRLREVGGVSRIHPYWSGVSTVPDIATGPKPMWGAGTIVSIATASAVTFHRRTGSFQALSVKTGRTISGIGPHELAHSEELEVDPVWVDFELQGLNVTWENGPGYTPDFHGHHATSGIVAGEVKAHRSYFENPEYSPIMANAARTFPSVGIGFRKIDASVLHANVVRRTNVRRAYCDRFTDFSPAQCERVLDAIDSEGEVALSRIHNILGNDPRTGQQIVHALLCRRLLAYDLDLPVNAATTVRAAPRAEANHDIRAIRETEPA